MRHVNQTLCLGILLLAAMLWCSVPAFAQINLEGVYMPQYHEDQPERLGGPEIGDYAGIPLNEAGRLMADAWSASILQAPEHQCKPHPADYSPRGPAGLSITKEVDPATLQTVALHTVVQWMSPTRTIWMDGRPRPDEFAPHTWQGFSLGTWEGPILKVVTTHLKKGSIRRNGIPRSDLAELTEYFYKHGDFLTWTAIINDPVYLTEPMIRTSDFRLNPGGNPPGVYPCQIAPETDQPHSWVPHWLPGENPDLELFAKAHGLPQEAARGGAATMYPEYRKKVVAPQPK